MNNIVPQSTNIAIIAPAAAGSEEPEVSRADKIQNAFLEYSRCKFAIQRLNEAIKDRLEADPDYSAAKSDLTRAQNELKVAKGEVEKENARIVEEIEDRKSDLHYWTEFLNDAIKFEVADRIRKDTKAPMQLSLFAHDGVEYFSDFVVKFKAKPAEVKGAENNQTHDSLASEDSFI